MLVTGALTALTRCKAVKALPWIDSMKPRRKPPMVIAVALANKMVRMTGAMMLRGAGYEPGARCGSDCGNDLSSRDIISLISIY